MGVIPPWSDLPLELLSAISDCLRSNPIDILSFRSVCKSWRSSSDSLQKLFSPFPLIIPSIPASLRRHNPYISNSGATNVTVTTVFALYPPTSDQLPSTSTRAWLIFIDQRSNGKITLRLPFFHICYSLPINFPRKLNLMSMHATLLCTFYNVGYMYAGHDAHPRSSVWDGLVRKVVSISNGSGNGKAVVSLSADGKLGLLRLGLGHGNEGLGDGAHWEVMHDGKGFRFDDIVEFRGRLLGINRRGRLYEIEIGCSAPFTMNTIATPIAGGGGWRKRLVESLGCLYLAVRCNARKGMGATFKVYVLREDARKWVEVRSLGDRSFFVGIGFSFSIAAEELHGSCGKNCVLYTDESFDNYKGHLYEDVFVFGLFLNLGPDDLRIGVWRLEDAHLDVIGSYPGYSNVFWPPPSWIWPIDKSERLGSLCNTLTLLQTRISHETLKDKLRKLKSFERKGATVLMDQILKMKDSLNSVKEMDEKMKAIAMVAVSLQQPSDSENSHNQVGIPVFGTEGRCVSVDSLQKAMELNNWEFDWHSMEMKVNALIFKLEETITNMEETVNNVCQ